MKYEDCPVWMTLQKRYKDLFMLVAEQSEKWVLHVQPRALFVKVYAEFSSSHPVLLCLS